MGDHTFFFYGTLIAPEILYRVCYGSQNPESWQKESLTMRPALLYGFRRHRVRGRAYPGILPVPSSAATSTSSDETTTTTTNGSSVPSASVHEGASVLGSLVSGLTDGDVRRLDHFEGSEYQKRQVRVRVLRSIAGSSQEEDLKDTLNAAQTHTTEEGEEIEATAYVWISGREWLEDAEWDFETFKRDKMKWWVGADERDWP
ncbi:hypothetical protein V8E54_004037 [Elaphomyces granulatus]